MHQLRCPGPHGGSIVLAWFCSAKLTRKPCVLPRTRGLEIQNIPTYNFVYKNVASAVYIVLSVPVRVFSITNKEKRVRVCTG